MKNRPSHPILALVLATLAIVVSAAPETRVSVVSKANSLPVLPWLSPTAEPERIGQFGEERLDSSTDVFGGWNEEELRLKFIVTDESHVAAPDASRLWLGDSLVLKIDARGDATGDLPPHTAGPIGSDDLRLFYGLLDEGAAGYSAARSRTPSSEQLSETIEAFYDPKTKKRVYDLTIPWTLISSAGGAYPTIGLDAQISDHDIGDTPQNSFWSSDAEFAASSFNTFVLGPPPEDQSFAQIFWDDTTVISPEQHNTLAVGIYNSEAHLEIEGASFQKSLHLTGNRSGKHYRIAVPEQADGVRLNARIKDASATAIQVNARELYRNLQDRLATLTSAPNIHPLFRLHLQSVKSQVETQWARTSLQVVDDSRQALETIDYFQQLLLGFHADAADWQAYRDGRRSLLVSYVSPYDQSIQYYFLGLPKDWDEHRAYPLFFELHGSGNPHPLARLARKLGAEVAAEDLLGYVAPKVYAEIDRSGYWVYPFCRGNLGYRDIAEIDVLETYDHAHRLFKIDPNRRYLYGFSMGGGGTWRIAQRTPGRWAAACSFAPSIRRDEDTSYLVGNLKQLPYKLMTGSDDFLMPDYMKILQKLADAGVPQPEARIIPNLPHRYLMDLQEEGIEWLKQFTRKRPDMFTFTTDEDLPQAIRTRRPCVNECWGVTLNLDHPTARFARAEVSRKSQTLTINTTGASSVSLDFSEPDGLGMTGDITIIINGTTTYQGEAKPLSFDI